MDISLCAEFRRPVARLTQQCVSTRRTSRRHSRASRASAILRPGWRSIVSGQIHASGRWRYDGLTKLSKHSLLNAVRFRCGLRTSGGVRSSTHLWQALFMRFRPTTKGGFPRLNVWSAKLKFTSLTVKDQSISRRYVRNLAFPAEVCTAPSTKFSAWGQSHSCGRSGCAPHSIVITGLNPVMTICDNVAYWALRACLAASTMLTSADFTSGQPRVLRPQSGLIQIWSAVR